jgi:hypothetical protein
MEPSTPSHSYWFGRQIDVAFCSVILFGTGLVAWTVEQYGHHRPR